MKLDTLTDKLFYEERGQMVISAIFGIALALVFQKICNDRKCIVLKGPSVDEVTSKVFQFEDNCFQYKPLSVKCPESNSKIVKTD